MVQEDIEIDGIVFAQFRVAMAEEYEWRWVARWQTVDDARWVELLHALRELGVESNLGDNVYVNGMTMDDVEQFMKLGEEHDDV